MQPFFLSVDSRRLFCLLWDTAAGASARSGVLLIPPIGEEMNQVRSFHARLGSRLARHGLQVLSVDLSSTGDSSGEFSDARWDDWCADILAARNWLAERVSVVLLVAVRSAALLLPALTRKGDERFERVVLVDPVISGDALLSEMLRVKVARSMFEGKRETLASLRAELERGSSVEVAGYVLSPSLYTGLRDARVDAQDLSQAGIVHVVRSSRGGSAKDSSDEQALSRVLGGTAEYQEKVLDFDLFWSNDQPEPPAPLIDELAGYFAA